MQNEEVSGIVRTAQIIITALMFGVISFAAFLFMFGLRANANPIPMMPIIAAAAAGVLALLSFVVPPAIHRKNIAALALGRFSLGRKPMPTSEEGRLASSRLAAFIIGGALLEGAAFLNLMAYMTNGTTYSVAVAGVLLVLMAARFPTAIGWDQRIEDDKRRLADARSMRG